MDAIDASAGTAPAQAPSKSKGASGLIAVAPLSPEPTPTRRWSKGQTIAAIVVGSLAGWACIVALVVILL